MWQIVSWLCMITAIFGYFLNVRKKKVCFVIWEAAAVGFILVNFLGTHDNAQALLNVFYLGFNAYGWWQWRKDDLNIQRSTP